MQQIICNAIFEVLAKRVGIEAVQKIRTPELEAEIIDKITNDTLFFFFTKKVLKFPGNIGKVEIKEKNVTKKKVYDYKSQGMVLRDMRNKKRIRVTLGEAVKEFLH